MNRRVITIGLAAAILLQLGVLAGEYLGAVYPLWSGQEIRLKTRPVDPRSLFRGNYARLGYAISRIELDEPARSGEVVYVSLRPGKDGLHEFAGASLQRPTEGVFLRGRLQHRPWRGEQTDVLYGIEAWFAPKEKALELERKLRDGAVAVIMVADNGRATLKAIETE